MNEQNIIEEKNVGSNLELMNLKNTEFAVALRKIFLGMIITTLKLEFIGLNYVLPFIGLILLFNGFRSIKTDNKYLKYCFIIICIRLTLFLKTLVYKASIVFTVFQNYFNQATIFYSVSALILNLLFLFFLKKGLIEIQKKAGVNYPLKSLDFIIIINIVLASVGYLIQFFVKPVVLTYFFFSFIVFIGTYIGFFIFFHKELKEHYQIYEVVSITKLRFSNKKVIFSIMLIFIIFIYLAYTTAGSYPMKWMLHNQNEHAELLAIKEDLVKKGFPDEYIDIISPEDIKACANAVRVESRIESDIDTPNNKDKFKVDNPHNMYSIIVELPNNEEQALYKYKVFHGFSSTKPLGAGGTECLIAGLSKGSTAYIVGKPSGRLLCDLDGAKYISPFYSLQYLNYELKEENGLNMFSKTISMPMAEFSLPSIAQNINGYISYNLEDMAEETHKINSHGFYVFQQSLFQYPVITAMDSYMQGRNQYSPFKTLHVSYGIYKYQE